MAKMEPTTSPLDSVNRAFPNPFAALVGQPLDDDQLDIAEINREAFSACKLLVEDVAGGNLSAALTVFGDAGTGKTHLIGRVRRWLETQPNNLFVFVRMETSPAGIWRHLRRRLAISLLTKSSDVRAMDRLFGDRKSVLERLENRDLSIVLEHLLEGRHVRDLEAWLRGEGLPEGVLNALALANPGPDDDPEVTARHLVVELCELIRPGALVFCMDQIEAIMSSPEDREGPHAFGRLASCLVDETHNAAVICCVQNTFINSLEQILEGAMRARVMGRRAVIQPLTWEQARRLISGRLDKLPELANERAGRGGCWPLDERQIKGVFVDNLAPARKIIARCKDLFDGWRFGQIEPLVPLEIALQRMLEERFTTTSPSETEAILRNGLPLLTRSAGLKGSAVGQRSPLDFSVEGKVAIAICNQANSTSLANHLKKISQAWKAGGGSRLLLLRDSRLPISRNAKATQQRIADVEKQGGRLVPVSQEAVEALAALRRLLSDAESGDLAYHGETIPAASVEQWITGHVPAALDQLVDDLKATEPAAPDLLPRLAALLAEQKMVKLEDAARTLEVSVGKLEECARSDSRQFGFFGGSLPVLFQPVSTSEAR